VQHPTIRKIPPKNIEYPAAVAKKLGKTLKILPNPCTVVTNSGIILKAGKSLNEEFQGTPMFLGL
jgi:hypothetical protein